MDKNFLYLCGINKSKISIDMLEHFCKNFGEEIYSKFINNKEIIYNEWVNSNFKTASPMKCNICDICKKLENSYNLDKNINYLILKFSGNDTTIITNSISNFHNFDINKNPNNDKNYISDLINKDNFDIVIFKYKE